LYTENRAKDIALFAKAVLSNQLARFAPAAYMQLTRQTGRGEQEQTAEQVAGYFIQCFDDYRKQMHFDAAGFASFLGGKQVLEYGPGDILGVALLMYAHGAETVHCVDRFPLHKVSAKNLQVYEHLLASLGPRERARADAAFTEHGQPASGFKPSTVAYLVSRDGLSGADRQYDLVISRAVLEHVGNLTGTVNDVARALKPDGVSIHEVDLRSHGLDRYQTFDFLTWPDPLYRLMFSQKGFPNRWRLNKYRELIEQSGLRISKLEPTGCVSEEKIGIIEPHLPRALRGVSRDELAWLGFWVTLMPAPNRASGSNAPQREPSSR
jgi:SAM-dependent methyltransferase